MAGLHIINMDARLIVECFTIILYSTVKRIIAGLDPAGPGFGYDNDTRLRLDSSDAVYVDVIHTNIDAVFELGLGVRTGHVDFYPNKGARQPGCATSGK